MRRFQPYGIAVLAIFLVAVCVLALNAGSPSTGVPQAVHAEVQRTQLADASGGAKASDEAAASGVSARHGEGSSWASEPDSPASDSTMTEPRAADSEYRQGEVLVQLADGVSVDDLADELTGSGISQGELQDGGAPGWVLVPLVDGVGVDDAIDALNTTGLVALSQPNFVYHLMEADSEQVSTMASANAGTTQLLAGGFDTFGLTNDPFGYENDWWLKAIGAPEAWAKQASARSITVAVFDTGCDVHHEDLHANVDAIRAYNAITGNTGAAAVADSDGHGTHVAGIISAIPNNGVGVAGVSANARLLPIKVIDEDTSSTTVLLKAYEYLMKLHASDPSIRIVNMSLGGSGGYDPALLRAIDKAYTNCNILSIFAAGNDDERTPYYCFPCDYAEVGVGVMNVGRAAATTLRGWQERSSNYNVGTEKTKDLSAPGVSIFSTYPSTLNAFEGGTGSTVQGYCYYSGTSMSTPVVSGVAALALAANPHLSAGDLKSVLCSSASDILRTNGSGAGFDAYTGYGLVRADRAVTGAANSYLKGRDAVRVGSSIALTPARSGKWVWSSNTPRVATVSSTGKVTGKAYGEAVISATDTKTGTKLSRTIVVYKTTVSGASTVVSGKKIRLVADTNPIALSNWASSKPKVASVNATTGVVTGKIAGKTTITATLTSAPNVKVSKVVTVTKATNPIAVRAKVKSVKYSKLRSKARKITGSIVFTKKAQGTVTYTKVAKGSSSRLSINKKTGAITVKKGTKRGTYKIKVRVRAAGNAKYKARTRTLTVKVKVV